PRGCQPRRVHGRRPDHRSEHAAGVLRQSAACADEAVLEPDIAVILAVIASEAKQSRNVPRTKSGLLRRCAPRNDEKAHTFSNGRSILVRFSSHSGTGSFFERMKL